MANNDPGKAPAKKRVLAIVGSASKHSSNLRLVQHIASLTEQRFETTVYDDLRRLPHFDPECSVENPPSAVVELRTAIADADAVLVCTPEYIFSLPSGLKNVFEWCVATTVFTNKPVGLITGSAHGAQGHEELQRILQTVQARFTAETALLVQGIKGKIDGAGRPTDGRTEGELLLFIAAFRRLTETPAS